MVKRNYVDIAFSKSLSSVDVGIMSNPIIFQDDTLLEWLIYKPISGKKQIYNSRLGDGRIQMKNVTQAIVFPFSNLRDIENLSHKFQSQLGEATVVNSHKENDCWNCKSKTISEIPAHRYDNTNLVSKEHICRECRSKTIIESLVELIHDNQEVIEAFYLKEYL